LHYNSQYKWCLLRSNLTTTTLTEYCITRNNLIEVRHGCFDKIDCGKCGWTLVGQGCSDKRITDSVPDVFFASIILFLGTFALAMTFRKFRGSRFFPTIVRLMLIFISITNSLPHSFVSTLRNVKI